MTRHIERGWLIDDAAGGKVSMSCHHRTKSKTLGACGGCYARLYFALLVISEGADAKKVTADTFAEMKAEAP